jgi:hypothetical protein
MKREEGMERLRAVLVAVLMFGLLGMIPMGCSDNDSGTSPVPPNIPTNRIYVMTIGSGVLTPAFESAGEVIALDANQDWEYMLTLDNITEDALWYANRPERKAGATSMQDYVGSWSKIYGDVSPNAVLDGYLTEPIHDGLYLNLKEPVYDAKTKSLTFQVTLLGSTMDNPHPVDPVDIYDIRITVFDNTPAGEVNYWSFGQATRESVIETTGTEGLYRLTLMGVYPELYQLQNAAGTRYEVLNQASLEYNWQTYFSTSAPNASLTGLSVANPGELKLALLEVDNPSSDGTNVYYDARVLGGQDLTNDSLSDVTLLIDAPDGQYPVCKQTAPEAECYSECFNSGSDPSPFCCPRKNPEKYNCGNTSKPDWWKYSLCKDASGNSPTGDICTTYQAPSGEQTTLVIKNGTDDPVTVFLQVGSSHATEGACVAPWTPIQLEEGGYPKCEKKDGDVCQWTLEGKASNTIKGLPNRCTNGTISFKKSPSDTCGMSLGEFTLNVDPTGSLTEGLDISLVNGNNGKIVVDLGSSWKVQTAGNFVTSIENYEGTGANNQDKPGVYNYLCDTCTAKVKPPNCPGTETCSKKETCNLLRDGARQGGTVTFTWKGTEW